MALMDPGSGGSAATPLREAMRDGSWCSDTARDGEGGRGGPSGKAAPAFCFWGTELDAVFFYKDDESAYQ
jgi:hypothetical protein